MNSFVFLPTRCHLRQCGNVFFGAGSRCEKCERKRAMRGAKQAFHEGICERLGVQPFRIEAKPKQARTYSAAERERRSKRMRALHEARA